MKLLPLQEAFAQAVGHTPHYVTLIRYAGSGDLKTYKVGHRRMTTTQDVLEFVRDRTARDEASKEKPASKRSAAKRQRDQARADKALSKMGA